jgi:hypothetical protein
MNSVTAPGTLVIPPDRSTYTPRNPGAGSGRQPGTAGVTRRAPLAGERCQSPLTRTVASADRHQPRVVDASRGCLPRSPHVVTSITSAIEPGNWLDAGPRWALTLVVPVFNETRRMSPGMSQIRALASSEILAGPLEVVVVDDGSTDGSADAARRHLNGLPGARVLELPRNAGKGAAVRTGVAAANSPVVAYLDADMAVDLNQLPELLSRLDDADIAIGSRAVDGARTVHSPVHRAVMGRLFNRIVKTATGLPIADTQCGFKAFRTTAARLLFHFLATDGFAFDVEALAIAQQLGMSIEEVPVQWHHRTGSRVRLVSDSAAMVADVLGNSRGRLAGRGAITVAGMWVSAVDPESLSAAKVRAAAGPLRPVLAPGDGTYLVLAPCEPGGALWEVGAELTRHVPLAHVEPCRLTFADLVRMTSARPDVTTAPEWLSGETCFSDGDLEIGSSVLSGAS